MLATVGGILLALLTTLPVSFYVTTIAFACYILARWGGTVIGRVRGVGGMRETESA
jgi:hypothetical protein